MSVVTVAVAGIRIPSPNSGRLAATVGAHLSGGALWRDRIWGRRPLSAHEQSFGVGSGSCGAPGLPDPAGATRPASSRVPPRRRRGGGHLPVPVPGTHGVEIPPDPWRRRTFSTSLILYSRSGRLDAVAGGGGVALPVVQSGGSSWMGRWP